MTTGCVRSTLEPDEHYEEDLVNRKSEMMDDEEDEEALCTENQEADQKKKPRRKDTPVLYSHPHIPGARLLKAEKQMIHSENEENDVKD